MKQALISVSDKTGVVDFARALVGLGYRILSTGGTARLLTDSGVSVTEVADYTGFPEILDGRVKTLHPRIHAGVLARQDRSAHMQALAAHRIEPIDLVAVNLYPFEATVARPEVDFDEAIENIDIGGPALLRAAAKNHGSVTVIVDPADYAVVLAELQRHGRVGSALRFALAKKVFAHTARYDGAISNYLSSLDEHGRRSAFPQTLTRQWEKVQDLRYGENPHQAAAFYRERTVAAGLLAGATQLQGKELSYNNLADADAAWQAVRGFEAPACVIVKHANPCGAAVAGDGATAYRRAFATDPTSAFGGIIAFNRTVDAACASAVSSQFVEVVIAPAFDEGARSIFAAKPNVRLLAVPAGDGADDLDFKRVGGGLLVQTPDTKQLRRAELRVVTRVQPSAAQLQDALFAWQVAKYVKSNAIVFARSGATLGIGAGQMSRIDAARLAAEKARAAGLTLTGAVAASDAFFPFRDGLDAVAEAGATCVIQPGGSLRDAEVIDAANARGIAMIFTGTRHFRH
ncbi:MAG: bifunctional phosphoribosylaminoimidazolecarboxamide formyltransferase/IMP cyclohydrolase [Sutterellaceae bacterium]|nr:bifunctional phosphoribosylaminoimidazolecarboxamide formyltransferase/IMP cyclohydrolase [Burkholderiaceae bacterium]MCX7900751.1 bifunctional phosphoribosylaminoimidazolecarboxamide formyltransferase/IMP cyclohydrolase [Burkholderiaceae bacterium]MDW8429866.1 bifunctional phosphoribosylaminoimidazolecarboxamide formyltransferase/IMP cyclohydrolase [Sutterellaceae bacterium]